MSWERETRLWLAGSSSLAASTPSSLLTSFISLFLLELYHYPDPLAATSRVLYHGAFS
jgi:hypothetical protein